MAIEEAAYWLKKKPFLALGFFQVAHILSTKSLKPYSQNIVQIQQHTSIMVVSKWQIAALQKMHPQHKQRLFWAASYLSFQSPRISYWAAYLSINPGPESAWATQLAVQHQFVRRLAREI